MYKIVFTSLILSLLLSGCGDSGGGGKSPGGTQEQAAKDLGYNPSERWPDKGSYSYHIRYSYNGALCETQQKFNNKADYCLGLQDQTLNKSCALPRRKEMYSQECGNDFQEINFSAHFWRSGFDARLQKHCETGRSRSTTFKTTKPYCEFLKDESLHENCFWEDRYQEFQNLNCAGDFSQEPAVVMPPQPTPEPPKPPDHPQKPQDPLDQLPVVRNLRAQGIQVEIAWGAIRLAETHPLPGEPPLQEKLETLWKEVSDSEHLILSRKSEITKITISTYTSYRAYRDSKQLFLDYETKQGSLEIYFPLLEKIRKYSVQFDIDFDFIHSGSSADSFSYLPLREMISAIEKNGAKLKLVKSLIKKVETESFSTYFPQSRALCLKYENIGEDFARYITKLQPLAPVYNWASQNNVELEANYDFERDFSRAKFALDVLEKSLSSLNQLMQAEMLKEITIYPQSVENHFFSDLKILLVGIGPDNEVAVTKTLQALGKMGRLRRELRRPISPVLSNLDENFEKAVMILETVLPKIKPKISKIQEISLSAESTYYSGLKELTIGYNSSLKETEEIIKSIR